MKTGSLPLVLLCGLLSNLGPSPLAAQSADVKKPAVPVFTAPPQETAPGKPAPAVGETGTAKAQPVVKATTLSPGLDEIVANPDIWMRRFRPAVGLTVNQDD